MQQSDVGVSLLVAVVAIHFLIWSDSYGFLFAFTVAALIARLYEWWQDWQFVRGLRAQGRR